MALYFTYMCVDNWKLDEIAYVCVYTSTYIDTYKYICITHGYILGVYDIVCIQAL